VGEGKWRSAEWHEKESKRRGAARQRGQMA